MLTTGPVHVNLRTMTSGPCGAKIRCPLGEAPHFQSQMEADAWIAEREAEGNPPVASVTRSSSGGYVAGDNSDDKPFTMNLSTPTVVVSRLLREGGYRPIIVGGSVRDQLLGNTSSKDIDIEVFSGDSGGNVDMETMARVFQGDRRFTVDEVGVSFAVLKVRHRGSDEEFDISLPRTERSTGMRHDDYEITHDATMSFTEAASRRDFTINSMGYDPNSGELLDPHGGRDDLKAGVLRHVSPAFADDPLRPLRAVNFASRFNLSVAPETLALCRELAPQYSSLSKERIEEEFNKLFNRGNHCEQGLTVLHDIGWAEQMPGFRDVNRNELQRAGELMNHVPHGIMRKVILDQVTGKQLSSVVTSVNMENEIVERTGRLIEAMRSGEREPIIRTHRSLARIYSDRESLERAISVLGVDTDSLAYPTEESPVTGRFLIERGFKPGPDMGRIIKQAQVIQDKTGITSAEELLRIAIR